MAGLFFSLGSGYMLEERLKEMEMMKAHSKRKGLIYPNVHAQFLEFYKELKGIPLMTVREYFREGTLWDHHGRQAYEKYKNWLIHELLLAGHIPDQLKQNEIRSDIALLARVRRSPTNALDIVWGWYDDAVFYFTDVRISKSGLLAKRTAKTRQKPSRSRKKSRGRGQHATA